MDNEITGADKKIHCVYKHTCPNGKVYIGITKKRPKDRWANGAGYATQFFGKAIRKYGWENIKHEIIADGLTEDEARKKEIEQISLNKSHNPKYGYNCTDGGEGIYGYRFSKEERKRMSERAFSLWENPEKKEFLLKHLADISEKNKGRKIPREIVEKRAQSLSMQVDQYDKSGAFIQTHNSLMDAARHLGKDFNSAIVACCKGKKKSYCGYIWKYHGEEITEEELAWRNSKDYHKREIVMCDDAWNEIKRFDGFHDAGRELGLSYKAIHSACKTGRHCGGYRWQYAN